MVFVPAPKGMCTMAARTTHWASREGYLDVLCKRQHLTCEARNFVKAPTETAIPSARVRSILHMKDDYDVNDSHVPCRPVFHTHRFGHYHVEADSLVASAHSINKHSVHQSTLPSKDPSSLSEDHLEDVYKEWTERSRPMCPCALALIEGHPAAAGIFLCRRSSCISQLLSLQQAGSTLSIPLSCEARFASGDALRKLNPNAPEFIPGSKQRTD